jgi:hypothetical protein
MRTIFTIEVRVDMSEGPDKERVKALVNKTAKRLYEDVAEITPLVKDTKGVTDKISDNHY